MAKNAVKTQPLLKRFGDNFSGRMDGILKKQTRAGSLRSILENLFYAFAGLLMARAVLFDVCAPFGISYLAAGIGKNERGSFYSLAGVFVGSLSLEGSGALHYAGAAILTFGLRYLLGDIRKLGRRIFFAPVLAGVVGGGVGIIFVIQQGFLLYDMIFWGTELILCAAGAYFLRIARPAVLQLTFGNRPSQQELYSILLALAVMLLGLTGVSIGGVEPAAFIGTLCILAVAGQRGAASGSLAGIAVGLVLSIGSRRLSFLPGACAFAGLLAGVFSETGRFGTAMAYVLSGSVIILYFGGPYQVLTFLTYSALAAALYIAIPSKVYLKLGLFTPSTTNENKRAERIREFLRSRIQEISGIYKEVSRSLSDLSEKYINKGTGEVSDVFFQASNKVCRRCGMKQFCWGQDFSTTMNAFNDITPILRKTGSVKRENMTSPFRERCLYLADLIAEINSAYEEFLTRERAKGRCEESRQLLSKEYELLAKVMDNLSLQLAQNLRFECEEEDRILRCLCQKGFRVKNVVCCGNGQGRVEVVVTFDGENISSVNPKELSQSISAVIGKTVAEPEFKMNHRELSARLLEKEQFDIRCGVSSRVKDGEKTNGDSMVCFKGGGKAVLVISDGMGSGNPAFAGSSLATQMIQQLLQAGIDRDTAIRLLNHALIIKSGGEYFATLDVAAVDLYSGEALFLKAGAAPAYICRGEEIFRVQSVSLPAGILEDVSYEEVRCKLREEDVIVMLSDGVIPGDSDDKWLKELLLGAVSKNPQTMADTLLTVACRNKGSRDDDMTVICAIVGKNE